MLTKPGGQNRTDLIVLLNMAARASVQRAGGGGGHKRKRSEYSFAHKALTDIPVSTDFQKIGALASCFFFVLGFQVTSRLDNLRSVF